MNEIFLKTAVEAAQLAGQFLRENLYLSGKQVNEATKHDIKLELDVRSQDLITKHLLGAHPEHALLGEEGTAGKAGSEFEWIVDPIDGTVNYFYEIPHFAVSIALRKAGELQVGVILDPMLNELWTVCKGGPALLNGTPIRVSERTELKDCAISVGFSKTASGMEAGFRNFQSLAFQVRKIRMFGSAALGLAWVASGRLDAYVEEALSLWDIAAGVLLIREAGGRIDMKALSEDETHFRVRASNGRLPLELD